MAKHTRGPWQILPEEVDKPYIRIRGTMLGGRFKVANVLTPVYEGVHEREAEETRANARLIAAAPDLLEALEAAYPIIERELYAQNAAYGPNFSQGKAEHVRNAVARARAALARVAQEG